MQIRNRAVTSSFFALTASIGLSFIALLEVPAHALPAPSNALSAPRPHPAPVDEYAIDLDGGIVYNPLSREAAKTGQIKLYDNVARTDHQLTLGNCKVDLRIPKRAVAYDVIPIPYTLTWSQDAHFPVGIEATAFQDPKRCIQKDLYDLTLPHHIDIATSYVGSVTAHLDPTQKQNITADFTDKPKIYPGFVCAPLVHSGTVASGDLVWFKLHLVNTGDTILGSEGFGGSLLYPELLRKDSSGVYQHFAYMVNLYSRNLHYWYPGESWDPWFIFPVVAAPGDPPESYHLPPGDYKMRIRLAYRSYKDSNPAIDYWDGPIVYTYDQPITVEAAARQTPVLDGEKQPSAGDYPDKLPTFIHKFEQFMTAFDLQLQPPTTSERTLHGVLNLQVAPWTHNVTLKLIGADPACITTVVVPIAVNDDSPRLAVKPDMRNTIVRKDGSRWPVFESQIMSDMRANVHMGPHPEQYIATDLGNMKSLGVNVLCSTEGSWDLSDKGNYPADYAGDAGKYALDVARRKGLQVDGWGIYPPFLPGIVEQGASWFSGKNFAGMETISGGYMLGNNNLSPIEPRMGEAYATIALYMFHRWGDLFYEAANGDVPIDIEDTRGWMRDDINVHFPLGQSGAVAFRKWVQAKYGTLEKTNTAWGTSYASFDAIDPDSHVADVFLSSYKDQTYPFHEWNQPMEDYDYWRTLIRLDLYRDILKDVRKEIPNATMELRTEGANVIVAGLDPQSPDSHIRHAYYSQRRCAVVAEPIVASGLIRYHSDYTTLPYTPTELRYLVRASVKQGIVPTYLPQFCDMRDIAVNDRYGNDYQVNYNLPAPKKGYMMHVLTASYPWYKIMDEEGGVPGILWEDYECDGFVTETQAKEMQFFQQKLKEALDHRGKTTTPPVPPQAWRRGSHAMKSYNLPASIH